MPQAIHPHRSGEEVVRGAYRMRLTKDCKYVLDRLIENPPEAPSEIYDYILWAQFIDENRLSFDRYRGVLETLATLGCIKWADGSSQRFYLLDTGRNYKELHRAEAISTLLNIALGFIGGVLSVVLAELIIDLIG